MFCTTRNANRKVSRHRRLVSLVLCVTVVACLASALQAGSLDGAAILRAIGTDNLGVETDRFEQNYTLQAFQQFSPYFSGRLNANYAQWNQVQRTDEEFETDLRRFQPGLYLDYSRDRVSANFGYLAINSDGTFATQSFKAQTFLANVYWRPAAAPTFNFGYRRQVNAADASVFGRDTRGDFFNFQTLYGRNWGSLRYNLDYNEQENNSSGTDIKQLRHQIMANWNKGLVDNRLNVGFTTRLSRVEQDATISGSNPIAEPVPPRQGLFAIDTAPEVGELLPEPRLIDGDATTPIPEIEIGAANTFRNIGVDLGVTRPVSRLEIGVDSPSDNTVVWQVYQSDDNILWQQVTGVSSFFDIDLFRYTIVFPETTNRFFKAVNVTPNSAPLVFVTEIRALIDRTDLSGGTQFESSSNLYRADGFATYRANRRLTFDGNVGFNSDQNVAEGFARREFREAHARAGLNYEISRGLRYDFAVQYFDIDDNSGIQLKRTERLFGGGFNWAPRPSVDLALRANRRDELTEGTLLQRNNSIRLGASLQLLPDMRLVADLNFLDIEQPGTMSDRSGYNWRADLQTRPAARWTLNLGYSHNLLRRPNGQVVLDRDQIYVQSTWSATAFLSFNGTWTLGRQAGYDTITQVFGVAYNPGPKLTLTGAYTDNTTEDTLAMMTRNSTGGRGVTLKYRFTRHVALFASLRESSTELEGVLATDIVTSRVELRVYF